MTAFRGKHVSPAKHSYAWLPRMCDCWTDRHTDGHTDAGQSDPYLAVLINRVLYQIQVTALLPFFLSILHMLLQLSKIMLWITVKLLLAIVMSIIFGPLKTLPRSSKSCDYVTFRVLKYLLSTFLRYTPHCHMILSKQTCCLWSTGVSRESQNLTSVLHWRQDFSATRNMTRIDVGLAWIYVKLLLSSWKTYMCNLMTWYINK